MKNKMFLKNKKGVVGETLTWFSAFIIIFFVMFLFFLSSFFVFGKTRGIKIEETENKIFLVKNLQSLMETSLPAGGVELRLIASFIMERQEILPNSIKIFLIDYLNSRKKNIISLLKTYEEFGAREILPKIKFRR